MIVNLIQDLLGLSRYHIDRKGPFDHGWVQLSGNPIRRWAALDLIKTFREWNPKAVYRIRRHSDRKGSEG